MTQFEQNDAAAGSSEASVARLLKLSGERGAVSESAFARAHAAARETWLRVVDERRARERRRNVRKLLFAGLAASALIAVAVSLVSTKAPHRPVATTVALEGLVAIERPDQNERSLRLGDTISSGTLVSTETGRVALSIDSLSVRLNRHSRLRVLTNESIELLTGELYVDSGVPKSDSILRVVTPAGLVMHVGTQFRVLVDGNRTQVAVREGQVRLITDSGQQFALGVHEQLELTGNGPAVRSTLAPYAVEWQWAAAAGPPMAIDGRTLYEFLAWIAREQGWDLQFQNAEVEAMSRSTQLHGELREIDPIEMLAGVSQITGIDLSYREGVLSVSLTPPAQ